MSSTIARRREVCALLAIPVRHVRGGPAEAAGRVAIHEGFHILYGADEPDFDPLVCVKESL